MEETDFYTATVTASNNPNVAVGQSISGEYVFDMGSFLGNAVLPNGTLMGDFTAGPTTVIENVNQFTAVNQSGIGLVITDPAGTNAAPTGFPVLLPGGTASGDIYSHGQTVAFSITSLIDPPPTAVPAPEVDFDTVTVAAALLFGIMALVTERRLNR